MGKTYVRGTLSRTERKLDHKDGTEREHLATVRRREREADALFWATIGDSELRGTPAW